jgi:hypothetical protein
MLLAHTGDDLLIDRIKCSGTAIVPQPPPTSDIFFLRDFDLVAEAVAIRAALLALRNTLRGLGLSNHSTTPETHPAKVARGHLFSPNDEAQTPRWERPNSMIFS